MRKAGKTENRPEQFKLKDHLVIQGLSPSKIELEYKVFSTDGAIIAKIDVADLEHKIAYRLRGAFSYHDGRRQTLTDDLQKEKLELRGWTVVDITEDSREWSWLWE